MSQLRRRDWCSRSLATYGSVLHLGPFAIDSSYPPRTQQGTALPEAVEVEPLVLNLHVKVQFLMPAYQDIRQSNTLEIGLP